MLAQLTVDETFDQGDAVQRLVEMVVVEPLVLSHAVQSGRIGSVDEHGLGTELRLIDEVMRTLLTIALDHGVGPRTRIDAWTSVHDWLDRRNRLLGLPSCD